MRNKIRSLRKSGGTSESLLGFDTYTRASNNLRTAVSADILRMPPKLRDETIEAAKTKWEEAQQVVARRKQRRGALPDEITIAETELREAQDEERRHNQEAVEAWVRQRDALRDDREGTKVAADEAAAHLNECFRDLEHVGYAATLVVEAIEHLDAAERAGQIPPSISSDILDRLIDDSTLPCVVCGRDMDAAAHEHVCYLRDAVTDSNVAANAIAMRSTLRAWERNARAQAERFAQRLDVDVTDVRDLAQLVEAVLTKADDAVIAARLRFAEAERALHEFEAEQDDDVDAEAGTRAEAILRARQRRLSELEQELEQIDALVEQAELDESAAKDEYERKAERQSEYRQKQLVQTLLADTAGVFDRISESMRRYGRTDFQRALNETYSKMINKPYVLEVADNFTVRATVAGRVRALSQSEKTALTLAFLGAVAGLAPQYRSLLRRADLGAMGNVRIGSDAYPVVLDAPYSPFDETYAGTITTAIGDLATQVVMTVSKSALGDISKISERVGRAYVLHMRTSSQNAPEGVFSDEQVAWLGNSARYVSIDDSVPDAITTVEAL